MDRAPPLQFEKGLQLFKLRWAHYSKHHGAQEAVGVPLRRGDLGHRRHLTWAGPPALPVHYHCGGCGGHIRRSIRLFVV